MTPTRGAANAYVYFIHRGESGRRKAPSSAWKSGHSGNPGGGPKIAGKIQERLASTAQSHRAPRGSEHSKNESVAVRAAEALDRGYGRPMQGMELTGQEERPVRRLIEVSFVAPPKRDEGNSIPAAPLPHRLL